MKRSLSLIFALMAFNATAVHLNHNGLGEVQLIPYYTVNNGLNTLVTVTNTKTIAKAIKVNVREGLNGYATLSYNVYLDANDTWTFALVSTTSTVPDYEGQDSAYQISTDTSCAPFLNKSQQEFLPYELLDGPQNISRVREGFIEIIEMGELNGDAAIFVDHESVGVPNNCAGLEAALAGGFWDETSGGSLNTDLSPATGGLMAEANLVNVAEGINFSMPAVALAGFYAQGTIAHTETDDTSLSLDAAEAVATVLTEDKTYQLSFESGIDAVSAVLMADELMGTYMLDSVVAGRSEAVFTQPTRRFYIGDQGNNNQPPYSSTNNRRIWCPRETGSDDFSQYGGTEVQTQFTSRDTQFVQPFSYLQGDPPPPRSYPAVCGSVSVWQFSQDVGNISSTITGSNNLRSVDNLNESGYFKINFVNLSPLVGTDINTNQILELVGRPVIGITLQQATNASAGPGLLAQYGAAQTIKSVLRVIEND